jgi:26S proteasome regulatory subunit T3
MPGWPLALPPLVAQEAGMLAVRKNRYVILPKDFEKAYKNVVRKASDSFEFYK